MPTPPIHHKKAFRTTGSTWRDLSSLVEFLKLCLKPINDSVFGGRASEAKCRATLAVRLGLTDTTLFRLLNLEYEGKTIHAVEMWLVQKCMSFGFKCSPESLEELGALVSGPIPRRRGHRASPEKEQPVQEVVIRRTLTATPTSKGIFLDDPWKERPVFQEAIRRFRRGLPPGKGTNDDVAKALGICSSSLSRLLREESVEIRPFQGKKTPLVVSPHPSRALAKDLEVVLGLDDMALGLSDGPDAPDGRRFVIMRLKPTELTVRMGVTTWEGSDVLPPPTPEPEPVPEPEPMPEPTTTPASRPIQLGLLKQLAHRFQVTGYTDAASHQTLNQLFAANL